MQITKDTLIGDILDQNAAVAPIFMSMGMHCLGCPASRGESLEDACAVHGVNVDDILSKINAVMGAEK
jgi:hybrid cluster-associated redox disulfide protein